MREKMNPMREKMIESLEKIMSSNIKGHSRVW
jgi:hypothetical protein